jgi:uncharacterized protein (UPF0332 family)
LPLVVFDWIDFLELAEDLASQPENEAAARTAVSRAYYATFHAGRAYLVRTGHAFDRSRNAHFQVQFELWQVREDIGREVQRLHSWRKTADYDRSGFDNAAKQARIATDVARETIFRINAISTVRDEDF